MLIAPPFAERRPGNHNRSSPCRFGQVELHPADPRSSHVRVVEKFPVGAAALVAAGCVVADDAGAGAACGGPSGKSGRSKVSKPPGRHRADRLRRATSCSTPARATLSPMEKTPLPSWPPFSKAPISPCATWSAWSPGTGGHARPEALYLQGPARVHRRAGSDTSPRSTWPTTIRAIGVPTACWTSSRCWRRRGCPISAAAATAQTAYRPLILERNGRRVALLGYDGFPPRSFEAGEHRAGAAWLTRRGGHRRTSRPPGASITPTW